MATEEKSNEITTVSLLLELLDIKGTIITADAMSCQREIVRKITEGGADYTIGLKDNQPTLCQEAQEHLEATLKEPEVYGPLAEMTIVDKGHGRIETRSYRLCTDSGFLDLYRKEWKNLNDIGMMESRVEKDGVITTGKHYHITSLTDVKEYAESARRHWGVESSLHWCLDVTFREDASRMRADHTAEKFAVVCHIVLNALKSMDDKMSVARRRQHCAYDDVYLEKVMLSIHA